MDKKLINKSQVLKEALSIPNAINNFANNDILSLILLMLSILITINY